MRITTKTGDGGQTNLRTKERVWKDNIRVEAYGTIDELNSCIGEAKHYVKTDEIKELLNKIQKDLFKVTRQLSGSSKDQTIYISEEEEKKLTEYVHHYEEIVQLKGWVVPGATEGSAKLDICRTVARRAERVITALKKEDFVPETALQFVNRLSDLLFIIARYEEMKENKLTYSKL